MIEISNICLHQNSIFIKFLKIFKIHEIFCENPRIIFVLFYDVHKENMFTINLEDGREAPYKASFINFYKSNLQKNCKLAQIRLNLYCKNKIVRNIKIKDIFWVLEPLEFKCLNTIVKYAKPICVYKRKTAPTSDIKWSKKKQIF